ncbi:MAG TPA: hypothetical protein VHM23_22235 [Actinomycetota bacterium]|jgi:hypothetical protein|nr:hypothetical protein [Actinomycetota bacterium]
MSDRVARVRIDRLVLRGVDLDLRDAGSLPARVAAALQQPSRGPEARVAEGADAQTIAVAIAQRVSEAAATARGEAR